ncbi:phytanoyl-CoA dioxygenase family protein [Aggregicoccus sp. 17bor-14]|uniref:phytanoyl-CoA dioxygenase family protein n=1 Tax=Myxococcaceae TaxID=31 RepID=UPI00129CB1F0|nr:MULTISPECIES: phytanoyl-CoA dioxygenase family protein [Myxococcaceae]MBF5040960.1 phytanoyl-CoA dioxygenase family protein [Simulacricoccus sp. 17bor-14]MRI86748.1 phytanoyl-CoA dioxygenase family protein [Aggregicoccus sp. 17bor-14]
MASPSPPPALLGVDPGAVDLRAPLAHYAEHGYARLGPVLSEAGLEALRTRVDDLMLGRVSYPGLFFQLDAESGRYEDAPLGLGYQGPSLGYRKLEKLEKDPLFLAWLQNPLFERVVRERIAGDAVLYRAIVFSKGASGGSNLPWHQDGGKLWGLSAEPELQIWTALDDAPEGGGCLEVVPGSHRAGLVTPIGGVIPEDRVQEARAEARAVAVPVRAGEALLVHNHVWHRSGRGRPGQRRRAFSACYMSASTRCLRTKKAPRVFFPVFRAPTG